VELALLYPLSNQGAVVVGGCPSFRRFNMGFDYELYEVIGEGTLKFVEKFPGEWDEHALVGILNARFFRVAGNDKPYVVLRTTRIATPEYFEAFAGVKACA